MPRKKGNAGRRGRTRRAGARKSTASATSDSIEEATECSPQTTPIRFSGTSPCVEEEVPATDAIAVPAPQTTPDAVKAHLSSPSVLPVDSAEPPPSTDEPIPGNDGLSGAQSPAVKVQSEGEPLIADSPHTDYSQLRQCEALSEVDPKETDKTSASPHPKNNNDAVPVAGQDTANDTPIESITVEAVTSSPGKAEKMVKKKVMVVRKINKKVPKKVVKVAHGSKAYETEKPAASGDATSVDLSPSVAASLRVENSNPDVSLEVEKPDEIVNSVRSHAMEAADKKDSIEASEAMEIVDKKGNIEASEAMQVVDKKDRIEESEAMEVKANDCGEEKVEMEGNDEENDGHDVAKGEDEVGEPMLFNEELEAMERRKRRKTEIFIGGLDKDTKEENTRQVFEQVREIMEVRLLVKGKTRKKKGSSNESVALLTAAGSSSSLEPKTPDSSQISQSTLPIKDDGKLKDMAHLYKTRLQIYAQKRGLALPVYTSVHEGPTNARRFKSKVTLEGEAYKSLEYFNTLKEAENAAAKVALSVVLPGGCEEDDIVFSKSLLQVFMQKEYRCLPKYTTSQFGASNVVEFASTVEVNGESFKGDKAKTKKQAEANAAKVAYTTLKERK